MILTSTPSRRVELTPVAYEFPDHRSSGLERDWDANWLMIRGEVRHPDGSEWTFTDPCLTTWEARELGDWLTAVARGHVTPAVRATGRVDLFFTEPNLTFSLTGADERQCELAVHFSLEALPPWLQRPSRPGIFDYAVTLTITRDDLTEAVQTWRQQLHQFPIR
jgi:hypothetical protein